MSDHKLGAWGAVWGAFWGRDLSYFPRVVAGKTECTLDSGAVLAEAATATEGLGDLGPVPTGAAGSDAAKPSPVLEAALALGRESLDEVKEQTEYQDQKALRLLTITTFLSAFSGVLVVRFSDAFPIAPLLKATDARLWPVGLSYLLFAAFVLCAVAGALVVFHATRTRFRYPSTDAPEGDAGSYLFVRGILASRPSAWAAKFVEAADERNGRQPRADLQVRYLETYIAETYLIAAKAADKLRYLEPAQDILAFAMRCLLLWLLVTGVVALTVPSTRPPVAPTPLTVHLDAPTPTVVRILEPAPPASRSAGQPSGAGEAARP